MIPRLDWRQLAWSCAFFAVIFLLALAIYRHLAVD